MTGNRRQNVCHFAVTEDVKMADNVQTSWDIEIYASKINRDPEPGKVRRVCNATSKYKEVCINNKLLAGPDLLHVLFRTIFWFREGPVALTADIESMLLQVQVPEQERSCLRFLWRPRTDKPVKIYEYQRHIIGATSSPTCANWILKRVSLDNEERVSNCNKSNTKQLLHGRFHQNGRNPWRSNWGLQSSTTSFFTTWIWTEEVDKQQRRSYRSNPRRLELNQQHK